MAGKKGRPGIGRLYGSEETTVVKITLTREQLEFLLEQYPDGVGAWARSVIDLGMRIQSEEMPDDYDPALWKALDQTVFHALTALDELRGGR